MARSRVSHRVVSAVVAAITIAAIAFAVIHVARIDAEGAAAAQEYRPSPAWVPQPRPVVAFIGDSYTAGAGASTGTSNFVALLAAEQGWDAVNDARGGTGYLATNGRAGCGLKFCPNYDGMIETVGRSDPDIVVVSGGRNDAAYPADEVDAAIVKFYVELRRALPEAQIIVTSPVWDARTPPAALAAIAREVRIAARQADAAYLDLGDPFTGRPELINDDEVHPNDDGHALLAELIDRRLTSALGFS